MARAQTVDTVLELLAPLVEYPTADLVDQARACAVAVRPHHARAARHIACFAEFAGRTAPGTLEELYTATFDLRPACYPYIGYQLFGETYKRGEFLAHLHARYRDADFALARELPDHLGAILRYLARTADADLVCEAAVPALEKMTDQLKDNPYRDPVLAILAILQDL